MTYVVNVLRNVPLAAVIAVVNIIARKTPAIVAISTEQTLKETHLHARSTLCNKECFWRASIPRREERRSKDEQYNHQQNEKI